MGDAYSAFPLRCPIAKLGGEKYIVRENLYETFIHGVFIKKNHKKCREFLALPNFIRRINHERRKEEVDHQCRRSRT